MIEVLQYIFSSFWIWLGTFLMIAACAAGIGWPGRAIAGERQSEARSCVWSAGAGPGGEAHGEK
jgi:hypothetical protein